MRILFVGTSEFGIPSLEALVREGCYEILVATKPDQVGGRGRICIPSPLKQSAQSLRLEVRAPEDINDPSTLAAFTDFNPDVMVVASFWAKLSDRLLAIPRLGGINLHPSLLPRFRGASPIQHTLMQGDARTGVTLFQIGAKVDGGDMLGMIEVDVDPRDNYLTLHDKLAEASAPLLLTVLKGLKEGTLVPKPQDDEKAVWAGKLTKKDGAIDWTRSAEVIERLIRAFSPWPGAFTFHGSGKKRIRLVLLESRLWEGEGETSPHHPGEIIDAKGRIIVACGEGALQVTRLKREGKKELSAEEFLRGMRIGLGDRFIKDDE